jgi:protein phosphatase
VVFGHVPTPEPQRLNNTIGLDTGCVFGGRLTAFRYPEKEIIQVAARREYYAPVKPFLETPAENDHVLNIDDVLGQKCLNARRCRNIRLNAGNTAAALEVMSRFAADPRWLIYLPPTMSPCETSPLDDYLEHPLEAFAYYRNRGVGRVICEVKHMGSRAVVVLAREAQTAARRFGVNDGSRGLVYSRTGRRFFDDPALEAALLARLEQVLTASGFWADFNTDRVCLDAEIMPWSAKAQKLILSQFAPAGLAGRLGLGRALAALEDAARKENYGFCREISAEALGKMGELAVSLRSSALFTEDSKEAKSVFRKQAFQKQASRKQVSLGFLEERLNELYWFCSSGNSIKADTLAGELKNTTHDRKTDALIKEICNHVENLDYHLVLQVLGEQPFIRQGESPLNTMDPLC